MNIATIKLTLMQEHNIATRGMTDEQVIELAVQHNLMEAPATPTPAPAPQAPAKPAPAPQAPAPAPAAGDLAAAIQAAIQAAIAVQPAQLDEAKVRELISQHVDKPRELVIKAYDKPEGKNVGVVHSCFDKASYLIARKRDLFFYGETGTGKSTTARKIADALDMPFFSMGSLMTKFETLGAMTPKDGYKPSIIRQWLESDSGLLCIDEIDASNPNALTSVMAIFDRDGGTLTFPDGVTLTRSENHRVIITGNTTGQGANAKYNSRLKLDDAFLTRFIRIEHGYDTGIENHIGGKMIADYARKFRAALAEKKLAGSIITPRAIADAATVYADTDAPLALRQDAIKDIFKQGMTDNDYDAVVRGIGQLTIDA